jgi:hypothetical protein
MPVDQIMLIVSFVIGLVGVPQPHQPDPSAGQPAQQEQHQPAQPVSHGGNK